MAMNAALAAESISTVDAISNGSTSGAYCLFNVFFCGSDPASYAFSVVTGAVFSSTIFSVQGVRGLPMLINNFFSTAYPDVAIGCSDGVKIIYNSASVPVLVKIKKEKYYLILTAYRLGSL
jgi:hypothetical protein